MRSKPLLVMISIIFALILMAGACATGFIIGWNFGPEPQTTQTVDQLITPQTSTDITTATQHMFTPFWEAWDIVHQQYVDQPVNDGLLMQGAIRGMMEALGDQHSSYMDPVQYGDAQAPLEGYEGIGAWVNSEGEYLTITEPMKGSPAEKAGLQPGDQVIAIDGESMTDILPEVARLKVLGPAGTKVTLTILREGVEQPFDVEITRASITIPSVEAEILEGDIAYLALNTFSDTTAGEMRSALEDLLAQNPKGLIFDLRYNSGGYLVTAVDVASEYIKEGLITYEVYGDGTRDDYNSNGKGLATDIPMVVLVNEWSASASELVAGAIQDYGRAPLVGVTTFGKGSVQNWIALSSDKGAIRVTIARWFTPEGHNVSDTGLTPDYEVLITDDDLQAGLDPQLDKAIELLTEN